MKLHLWTAAEVEEHLSGDAIILRGTYFGELVLTPLLNLLQSLHNEKVATIKKRWLPDVHQTIQNVFSEKCLGKLVPGTNLILSQNN